MTIAFSPETSRLRVTRQFAQTFADKHLIKAVERQRERINELEAELEISEKRGFNPTIEIGSALYRCGADKMRDTIAFCGPSNRGRIIDGYGFMGHAWLRLAADLIDFTDWTTSAITCILSNLGA
jgi:hypothetical protein